MRARGATAVPVVDDGVLLSTVVGSSAVMVAIIGGLLVSRLLVLVGERQSLERRVAELTAVRDRREEDQQSSRSALIADEADEFIDDIMDDYFEPWADGGRAAYDQLHQRHSPETTTKEDLRPYFGEFEAEVVRVHENIVARVKAGETLADILDELDDNSRASDISYKVNEVYEAMAEKEAAKRVQDEEVSHPFRAGLGFSPPIDLLRSLGTSPDMLQVSAIRSIPAQNRRRDLRSAHESARANLATAELDLKHARAALASASRPKGIWLPIIVLGIIAVAGMIMPLEAMATLESPLGMGTRSLYVIIFGLSTLIFIIFLLIEIFRIRRRIAR